MTGVVDGLQAYNANSKTPFFDAPDVTVGEVAKLVVKYVNAHPTSAKLPTPGQVLEDTTVVFQKGRIDQPADIIPGTVPAALAQEAGTLEPRQKAAAGCAQ